MWQALDWGEEVTPKGSQSLGGHACAHTRCAGVQVQASCDFRFLGLQEGEARSVCRVRKVLRFLTSSLMMEEGARKGTLG